MHTNNNKVMRATLMMLLILMVILEVHGQVAGKVMVWECNKLKDLKSGEEVLLYTGKLVTEGSRIVWKQGDPEFSTEFSILSREGSWPDVQVEGWIRYKVKALNRIGTIEFKRQGTTVEVSFDFPEGGINTMPIVLQISKVSPQ
ncbi:MAG: hypothetical protein DYG99_13230 [Bacteroidetes bacterium CHB5]|nr:hypothetical protein [Bacteroidetes bacterium CHB5]